MRVVGVYYPRRGSSLLGSVVLPLLGLRGGGLRWRFTGVSGIRVWERAKDTFVRGNIGCLDPYLLGGTYVWLGLCHPRGRRCERGGVLVPFSCWG